MFGITIIINITTIPIIIIIAIIICRHQNSIIITHTASWGPYGISCIRVFFNNESLLIYIDIPTVFQHDLKTLYDMTFLFMYFTLVLVFYVLSYVYKALVIINYCEP